MLVIDRFEGDFAVVETSKGMVSIPRADLPPGAKEGDSLKISIDAGATEERQKRIDDKMNKLFK